MTERYRPFIKHEKRLHKLRTEPWAYEYRPIGPPPVQPKEAETPTPAATLAVLMLALLKLIFPLPEDIEGRTNTNAPERIAKT